MCSIWNLMDIIGLLLVAFVLIVTIAGVYPISVESLRIIAAFASFFTLVKIIDWLRLFEETAFFYYLVEVTLYDIRYFVVLLMTALLMFGVPLVFLDANSMSEKELIEGIFGFWVLDLIYNQYLLSLGEFGLDNFGDHPQAVLVYVIFVSATFISQLTMLNMLIAIMGDSFAKVYENREVNGTRMKLQILSDLGTCLPRAGNVERTETNLLVARPSETDEDTGDDWEGTINRLTKVVERQSKMIQEKLGSKSDQLQATVEENAKKELV